MRVFECKLECQSAEFAGSPAFRVAMEGNKRTGGVLTSMGHLEELSSCTLLRYRPSMMILCTSCQGIELY